jgi:dTDP-4-amino-4,6-dideoxygalactose transaminase
MTGDISIYQSEILLSPERVGTIIAILALIVWLYTAILAKKNQKRNELFLHYQYKLEELKDRIYKTPELIKEKDSNRWELLKILLDNHKEYARIYQKMKKEFSLEDI